METNINNLEPAHITRQRKITALLSLCYESLEEYNKICSAAEKLEYISNSLKFQLNLNKEKLRFAEGFNEAMKKDK